MPDAPTASRRRRVVDVRLLIGLALVIGSVAGVLGIVSAGDRRTTVYAAASSLSPGDRIDSSDLVARQVSLDSAEQLYLVPGDLPDDGLVVGEAVRVGELVPRAAVASVEGQRSTSLVLELSGRVSAAVVPGAIVDIWAAPQVSGDVASLGAFGPPIVLTPDAVVVRVVEDEGLVAASDGDAVEVLVPRIRIARLLQAIANGDALAIVPGGDSAGRAMTAFAIAVPFDDEQRLVSDAGRFGYSVVERCSGADELASRLGSGTVEAALVVADPQYLNARLIEACDAASVRLLVVAQHPDQLRFARSLGIADARVGTVDWAVASGDAQSAGDGVPRTTVTDIEVGARRAEVPRVQRRGTVIAVWGPAGAPGRTSLAIAIAAELADAGASVALGDADTHAASIDPALGLLDEAPGFAAACRLAGAGALTVAEFERIAEWNRSGRSGFWVLTGLGRPARWPELTAERVTGAIAAAREWVDVLVLDTAASLEQDEELSSDLVAPRRNAATLASVRSADHVIAVAAADPIGLARYLRGHAELLECAVPDRVTTVVNKVRSSAIGINPTSQISQTLARYGGVTDPALVPWDPAAFDAALLGGRPLLDAAPRSAARIAIRKLVRDRIALPVARSRRRRWA